MVQIPNDLQFLNPPKAIQDVQGRDDKPLSGGTELTKIASEDIASFRVLGINADEKFFLIDSTDPSQMQTVIGVSKNGGPTGSKITAIQQGRLTLLNHGFPANSILYLNGENGEISDTEPVSGFWHIVGKVVTDNIIEIDVQTNPPIRL